MWELKTDEAGVLVEALHLLLGQGSEYFLNEVKLVHFAVAREQRLAVAQLAHDAADGPHVYLRAVVSVAEQQLWRTVPPRCNVVRHLASFQPGSSEILRKRPRKPEVTDLQRVVLPSLC